MIPDNAERILNDDMNIIGFRVDGIDNYRGIPFAEDLEFGKVIQNYWINFMKNGDPNGEGLVKWPKYDTGEVLNLSNTIEVGPRKAEPMIDVLLPLYFHD